METIWNYGWNIVLAILFLFLFLKLRKRPGGSFWLLASLCMIPAAICYNNHFITSIPMAYGCLVLWFAGMIFPWYKLPPAGAIFYFILDLISLPSALLLGIAWTASSWQFIASALFCILMMIINGILIFFTMKNTKTSF